jgi:hypothetical protein
MWNRTGVLPGVQGVMKDLAQACAVLYLGENKRTVTTHQASVTLHDLEVRADRLGEISFVDHEEVGLRNAGTAFARNFVAAGDIDNIDSVIGKFTTEMGGQIIPAGFKEQDLRMEEFMELLQRQEIGGDIFADGGVRAAARFHGPDAFRRERLVTNQEFTIFPGEDVIGDHGKVHSIPQFPAERQHERGLAAAHRAADPDRKGPVGQVTTERLVAVVKMAGVGQLFVGVFVAAGGMVVVRMRIHVKS